MQSLKIGRFFGIDIELHWISVIFLLLFLLVSLYAFLLMLLLLVSVLLHELAHAVTSIRNKVKVSKIIIVLPIGGLSVLDETNIKPKTEFRIAIAGPVMSLLLGSIFGVFVSFTPPGLLTQICQFMFEINILLGILNLLPAFPTDGGRVFRSYLQRRYSFYKATMLTVKVSKGLVYALIIGTIAYLFAISASLYYKEMLFIITLFTVLILYDGAEAEQETAELKEKTKGISLKDVVTKGFIVVKPKTTLPELYSVLKRSKRHIVLTKIGKAYWYVNIFDKKRLGFAKSAAELAVAAPNMDLKTNIADALLELENKGTNIGIVLRGNRLVGIVTLQHIEAFITLHLSQSQRTSSNAPEA